jgi:hypothetical protein
MTLRLSFSTALRGGDRNAVTRSLVCERHHVIM